MDAILAFSAGKDVQVNDKTTVKGKKRKFLETVELQIGAHQCVCSGCLSLTPSARVLTAWHVLWCTQH